MHRFLLLLAVIVAVSLSLATGKGRTTRAAQTAEIAIPFTLTSHNNIVISALLNGTDTLNLMLHTAARDVTLTEEAVRKAKSIKFTNTTKVQSWGGESDSRYSKGNQLQLGPLQRKNLNIWEDKNSGHDTDGKFGLDFFENRIVEIDFDQHRIGLHQSTSSDV